MVQLKKQSNLALPCLRDCLKWKLFFVHKLHSGLHLSYAMPQQPKITRVLAAALGGGQFEALPAILECGIKKIL